MRPVAWPPAGLSDPAERRRRYSPGPGPAPGNARGEGRRSWGEGRHAAAPGARARPTAPARTPAPVAPRSDVRPRPRTAPGLSPWRPPPAREDALWPRAWPPSAAPRSPPGLAAAARRSPHGRPPLMAPPRARSQAAGRAVWLAVRLHLKPRRPADEIPPQPPP